MSKYECKECHLPVDDQYMVKDELWKKFHGSPRGVLHIACLEKRMGRPLTLDDLTRAPINLPLRVQMGDQTIDPSSPSMMAYRWNNAGKAEWDHTKFDLVPGMMVVARKNYDPTGAHVHRGDTGFVFGSSNVYGDEAGPIVKWIKGGVCNIYPHMSEVIWWDDSVWQFSRNKVVPEPDAIRGLLNYSWKDINFEYDSLTSEEKKVISPEQFERLKAWLDP